MFVYLDESGDLGFDFTKGGTSRFFVVTLLVIRNYENNKRLMKVVETTIKNKVARRKKKKIGILELKGAKTAPSVKSYFYRRSSQVQFQIFTLILNKVRVTRPLF